mmetsp:Transcript_42124/g.48887  ORF Transcript_42124/g.48887 Transcript_42124/m.48887 type:complete len:118 (-) Transcript_42124:719-1072(-)
MDRADFVIAGCSMKTIQIIDMMVCLLKSLNLAGMSKYNEPQIVEHIRKRQMGTSPAREVLNRSTVGANPVIRVESKNHSNETNVSDEAPIVSIGPKMLDRDMGNPRLNDIEAVISCR